MNKTLYRIESHFLGDPADTVGPRCQFRRYVVEIFLENGSAKQGRLKLKHDAQILYYFGNTPIDGIHVTVSANTENCSVNGHESFKTKDMAVEWSCDSIVHAEKERQKVARLMMCFCSWGMEYAEIEKYASREMISADEADVATADGAEIAVTENRYLGVVMPEPSQLPPNCPHDIPYGSFLSRFAVFADAHIGVRYAWKNYDWLHSVFDNIKKIHTQTPLDFIVQLGDNIDDGYPSTYKQDYDTYLEEIKRLEICDHEKPIDGAKNGKIPNYEMQGNHDTSPDTRFFKQKLWYTENQNGEKVGYVSFFASYGGYPLVNYRVAGNYSSYRSYGWISDETIAFVEESVTEAERNGAKYVVLFCHYGISQDVGAPILPETGLGKLANICKKHRIKLYFNGHEHDRDFSHRMYDEIHDFDVSMLHDKYAVVEIYENICKVIIYETEGQTICREEFVQLV